MARTKSKSPAVKPTYDDSFAQQLGDRIRSMTPACRQAFLGSLPEADLKEMQHWWAVWARPNQLAPKGDWLVWLVMAGRGWGKTRTGAEDVKEYGLKHPNSRIALIAQTFGDGRKVMYEGESGLLSILPEEFLYKKSRDRAYNSTLGELRLQNGTLYTLYTSERPNQLRGPQHHRAWGDECGHWLDAHLGMANDTTYSNLVLGLRLGTDPKIVLTTTPKRNSKGKKNSLLLKQILAGQPKGETVVTRGTTYENLTNLSPTFKKQVLDKYEGTTLGLQEIQGMLLDEEEGSLWTQEMIDDARLKDDTGKPSHGLPVGVELTRIVVALDPAGKIQDMVKFTLGEKVVGESTGDDAGIVAVGYGNDGRYYVLQDASCNGSPKTWGEAAVKAYRKWSADRICGEKNHGGETVEEVIRFVGIQQNVDVSYKDTWASKGKVIRAEPISALYEQGKVKHVGDFHELNNELVNWVPGNASPNRLDALVIALSELSQGGGPVEEEDDPFNELEERF